MPLFDFFKKPGKKKQQNAAQQPATDNPFSSPEKNKERYEAAMEFEQVFRDKTPLLHGRPHAGTVMSAAAQLAGTSLYRAINKREIAPGSIVLSGKVNTAYPELLKLFAYFCKQNGFDVMDRPLLTEFPEDDKPLMDLTQIREIYQEEYDEIMKKHGLDYLEGARAGMIVCSNFFDYLCIKSNAIDPYVATGIVAMGVVEGAKTSPAPLNSNGAASTAKNDSKDEQVSQLIRTIAESSTSGSGTRLVLGEIFSAGKEAQNNGGKYILVHPEVKEQLKGANIDLYVIYVTAAMIEMENRIPKIEFVDMNVDELAQQWSDKPDAQTPMHVRQMLWLKENAEKFGYQQSGNSWKLKG